MTALPPRPMHNFFPLRFSPPPAVTPAERQSMIATEAYYRAERRGFETGHEVEDWQAAEAEVDTRIDNARKWTGITI